MFVPVKLPSKVRLSASRSNHHHRRATVKKLRILIADDHELVRRGACAVLHSQRGWRVVGEAVNGWEAVEKAIDLKPDVAVVDISMPELEGIEAVRKICKAVPSSKVLVLTMHESDHMVQRALDAGAHGYILKSDLTECLVKAIKVASSGKPFLTPGVSKIMLQGSLKAERERHQSEHSAARTTPRETEITRLLAEGKTNKEVAALLGIAVRTVETHRAKIMLKLGLHSLPELIHYAIRQGITTVQGI
jgi:DNA-binding NarL/FixJ family response regulator